MEVTDALVDHLANLSRLEFSGDEKTRIKEDMAKIIGFVEKLNELDTTGVAPLRHMSADHTVTRADEPHAPMDAAKALEPAPHHNASFFMVPKFIQKES